MTGQKYYAIDLYMDWAYGRDETVCQSDVMDYCNDHGFDYKEIVTLGDIEARKMGIKVV